MKRIGMKVGLLVVGALQVEASAQTVLQPGTMPQIGQVGERYLSYNIEAVEVTGGRFWKPYKSIAAAPVTASEAKQNQPVGMDENLFQYRAPINLYNPRLRKLAAGLAPAFVRVSGTWRNSTYFQDDDKPAPAVAPDGYKGVMTRAEWKGVLDFSWAVDGEVVASVATSAGTRDKSGVWTPEQARVFFDATKRLGGKIAAVEYMNEPTFAAIGGAPDDYDGAAFAKDVKIFDAFLRKESPGTIFLGPGSIGEGVPIMEGAPMPKMIRTEEMLKGTGPIFDAFSYHFYGTVSKRCQGTMSPERALAPEWFGKNVAVEEFYAKLRDQYVPGKAMWLTETGEAACGGDTWATTFLDVFRFMDQLGTLAQKSVQSVMVNTLASSDYGLLDEETLEARPNYWAAVLWKRTMGTRVLDPGLRPNANVRVYAQCMKGAKGGVSLLVLNLDRAKAQMLNVPMVGEQFTLSSPELSSTKVLLNGVELKAGSDGSLPRMQGERVKAGEVLFAPLTVTFMELAGAENSACSQ